MTKLMTIDKKPNQCHVYLTGISNYNYNSNNRTNNSLVNTKYGYNYSDSDVWENKIIETKVKES